MDDSDPSAVVPAPPVPTFPMNPFRILGDVSHTVSVCILIWSIHSNRSAEGVSLTTQMLYTLVFCSRYLDLFWVNPAISYWNTTLKIFYIASSLYIFVVMMRVFPRTREREKAWRLGAYSLLGSAVLAPIMVLIFEPLWMFRTWEPIWVFSLILEATCILPQLLLLRQTTVPTVIDSFYLATLGSYRFFYILNWLVRAVQTRGLGWDGKGTPIEIIFGIVQTALYIDFAWVYFSRQRVKLRGGAMMDGDDFRKGWLVKWAMGKNFRDSGEEEERLAGDYENGTHRHDSQSRATNGWSRGGISVSADEGAHGEMEDPSVFEDEPAQDPRRVNAARRQPESIRQSKSSTESVNEDQAGAVVPEGISDGSEWQDR